MNLQNQFAELMVNYKDAIEELIRTYLAGWNQSDRLKKACSYALLNGGKRFRPALVQMVAKALGREGQADGAALAIEFFHTASLIADDLPCMDDDDERRDRPSLHVAYDEATALLTSYALIAAGYGCIADNCHYLGSAGGKVCVLAVENAALNTGIRGATGGQFLDLFPPDVEENTLQEVIRKKTVSLFEVSFIFGWLFGGGDSEKLEQVKCISEHFGMAFQIADDLDDQAQDMANGRLMNFATVLGSEKALTTLQNHLASYHRGLTSLGIDSPELSLLGDLLYTAGR